MAKKIQLLGPIARMLILLLDGPKFNRQLIKDSVNPSGIGGPDTVRNARNFLERKGLVKVYEGEETPRPRTYTELTNIGTQAATHLHAVDEILKKNSQ